jgi:hypothetical protein
VIEASYGGVTPIRVEKTLAPGAREVVTVAIPGDPRKLVATPDAGKGSTGSSTLRTAGFVVLGVGVASGVGVAIAAVIRASAQSTVEQSGSGPGPNVTCAPSATADANDAISRGKTASTMLNVLIPLTVAGVGAGVTLIAVGSIAKPSAPAATAGARGVEISLAPTLDGARLRIGGRF